MIKTPIFLVMVSSFVAGSPNVWGAPSLEEMKQRCDKARAEKITPLREAAIDECVSQRRSSRTREDCERIYSDFGERAGRRPALFIDLPECVEYFDARDGQRSGSSRR
jgi:hypothetical protein